MRRPPIAVCVLAMFAVGCATPVGWPGTWPSLEIPWGQAPVELETTASAALPAPEGVTVASGVLRAVPITWDPVLVGDVGGYLLERAPMREGPYRRIARVEGRAQTAYLDRGELLSDEPPMPMDDGDTFFYRVRAYTSAGHVAIEVSEVAVGTTALPPDPPADLRSYSHQPRMVPLSWRASDNPTVQGYVVYRSPSSQGPFELLARLSGPHSTIYVDRNLGALRVFYYRVVARNAAGGQGEPSEAVQAVTKSEPLPPMGLRVVAQRLGANRLTWEPNVETDLVKYELRRFRTGEDAAEVVTALPPDVREVEDMEVGAREQLSYTLIAADRDGLESPASRRIGVESEGYGLSARVESDGVHLAWNPRTDEGFVGARVFRREWLRQRDLGFVESAEFVDHQVSPGRSYRYTVVLERPGAVAAPPSIPLGVRIPRDDGRFR